MKRYGIITKVYGIGIDEKEDVFTLAEAKARAKDYIKAQNYDGVCIYDHKTQKSVLYYKSFSADNIAADYRGENAKYMYI